MTVLILATVTGNAKSGLAYLAPDVLHGDWESSLQQQAPESLYRVMAAGRLVDADRIGPPGRTNDPDITIRQRPARSSLYPDSRRTYPRPRYSTILSPSVTSPSRQSYQSRNFAKGPELFWNNLGYSFPGVNAELHLIHFRVVVQGFCPFTWFPYSLHRSCAQQLLYGQQSRLSPVRKPEGSTPHQISHCTSRPDRLCREVNISSHQTLRAYRSWNDRKIRAALFRLQLRSNCCRQRPHALPSIY